MQDMRAVRLSAGDPKLEKMARISGLGKSTLSESSSGRTIPTANAVKAYLTGCGVEESELVCWEQRHARMVEAAKRFAPDLTGCRTLSDLLAALRVLVRESEVDPQELALRLTRAGNERLASALSGSAPALSAIDDLLAGRSELSREILSYLVFAVGGLRGDVLHWQKEFDRLSGRCREPAAGRARPPATAVPEQSTALAVAKPPGPTEKGRPVDRSLLRRPGTVVVAAVIVLVVLVGAAVLLVSRHPAGTLIPFPPSLPSSAPGGQEELDATDELTALGRRVRILPEARIEQEDAVIGRRVSSWSTTLPQPDPVRVVEYRRWATGDGVVCETSTEFGPDGRRGPESPRDCARIRIRVPDPSADPDRLAEQLLAEHGSEPLATGRIRGVAKLHGDHCLGATQRAAIAELLARTPGLAHRGWFVVDPHRKGLAFSIDTDNGYSVTRDIVVFDPQDGRVLVHEVILNPDSETPVTESRTHYLGCNPDGNAD